MRIRAHRPAAQRARVLVAFWSRDMKVIVGTELCQHAHVGFLAHGQIHIQYADGCTVEFATPQAVTNRTGARRLGGRG